MPTESDDGRLSVDRGSFTTPTGAFDLYLLTGRISVGVCGLKVGEFSTEKLLCYPDPLKAPPEKVANEAHALVDFQGMKSNSQRKKVAKRLKRLAIGRGFLHQV
jgi:hypothetical protein